MSDDIRGPVISAISGFVGVLVGTALIPWVRGHLSRKRAARYLAIRVVCILDKYLEDCAEVVLDSGEEDQHGYTHARVSSPPPPSYPADLDWHSIDYTLMYDLLSLPTMAEKAASVVSNAGEYADPPHHEQFFEMRSFQYSKLGLKAFELAQKLRSQYKIAELDFSEWNPADRLKEELQKIKDERARREAAHAQMIPPPPPSGWIRG